MERYLTVKRALLVLCLLAVPALAGCQTTAGFGRDVQQVGRWIEGGAQDAEGWVFGSRAEAAMTGETPEQPMTSAEGSEQAMTPAAGGNVVYFKTGSAQIPPDGLEMIRAIAGKAEQGAQKIEVTGYTDTAGPAEYNEKLSQRRAEAVADEFTAQGLRRESIIVKWHGENQLPVPTEDNVPKRENRRVSIAMTSE